MPLMYNILGGEYRSVFSELREGGRFDTGFSPSSVGKDCPMYWFDNCITGPTAASLSEPHEYPCSWNGPVWPFATSLILDSLGRAARECKDLEDTFDRIFNEYTSLHFDFGDRSTPVICESYRPTDGLSFSPYTEYFHSEWLNLFFSHYLGISVEEDGSIRFSPITNAEFEVSNVELRGKNYRFAQKIENGSAIRIMEEI